MISRLARARSSNCAISFWYGCLATTSSCCAVRSPSASPFPARRSRAGSASAACSKRRAVELREQLLRAVEQAGLEEVLRELERARRALCRRGRSGRSSRFWCMRIARSISPRRRNRMPSAKCRSIVCGSTLTTSMNDSIALSGCSFSRKLRPRKYDSGSARDSRSRCLMSMRAAIQPSAKNSGGSAAATRARIPSRCAAGPRRPATMPRRRRASGARARPRHARASSASDLAPLRAAMHATPASRPSATPRRKRRSSTNISGACQLEPMKKRSVTGSVFCSGTASSSTNEQRSGHVRQIHDARRTRRRIGSVTPARTKKAARSCDARRADSMPRMRICFLKSTRSRNSLPALKCGTYFSGTCTFSPDFGLRPVRGGR